MPSSDFLFGCIERLQATHIHEIIRHEAIFGVAVAYWLSQRLRKWTHLEVSKAECIQDLKLEDDLVREVKDELNAIQNNSEKAAEELLLPTTTSNHHHLHHHLHHPSHRTQEQTKKTKRKKKKPKPCTDCDATLQREEEGRGEEGRGTPAQTQEKSYSDLVTEWNAPFAASRGWEATLIGSGRFFRASDADVVLTVQGGTSLQEAYEEVRRETGLTPQYNKVTGERVSILSGEYQGILLEVQVCRRCTAPTPSEKASMRSIRLTNLLAKELDGGAEERISRMHEWAEASGAKGQKKGMLPGIAVTMLAGVAFGDGNQLKAWRDLLSCVAPRWKLGGVDATKDRSSRPEVALDVCAEEGCSLTAERMSTCTTRHLLDLVAFSLTVEDTRLANREVYAEWRRNTMVVAARLPLHKVASTLPNSLHNLDGHPLLDTLYLHDQGETCTVLCTLRDADANVYGMKEGHTWEKVSDTEVHVQKGGRKWPLSITTPDKHSPAILAHTHSSAKVYQRIPVTQGGKEYIPNAPYLTVEVTQALTRHT